MMEPAERPRTDATAATPSFTRGLFAGAVHDSLVFPFHEPLEVTRPDEAQIVRRLIAELHRLRDERVIDSQRFDEEETIGDEAVQALARAGFLGLTLSLIHI